MEIWLTFAAVGAATFAYRWSFIGGLGGRSLNPDWQRLLRFVPPAALAALAFPDLLAPGGHLQLSFGNTRLLAAILAGLVAWKTRSVLATIAVGMSAQWALAAL